SRQPRGGSGHASPSRARSLLGSNTIDETPCRAHSSTRRRSRTVLPEPEPANTATCLRSDSNGSQHGTPSTVPTLTAGTSGRWSAGSPAPNDVLSPGPSSDSIPSPGPALAGLVPLGTVSDGMLPPGLASDAMRPLGAVSDGVLPSDLAPTATAAL